MAPHQQSVTVWQGQVPFRVHVKGQGPALVFFHGPWGLTWGPFLDSLARNFTVYAPEHPGTTPDLPDAVQPIDNLWDLVLCYDELLDRLKLSDVMLAGHSFGAMVACELAALQSSRILRLVLVDPESAPAKALFSVPENFDDAALARTRLTWAMGATGKFIWPIPDKGLKKRIHRVQAPTLLVWGEKDRLVPPLYAGEFARRLPRTRHEVVKNAGHAPHLEQPEATAEIVQTFLRA
jgi:pimeloyl-ACP methyl ester carboxylesterase